MYIIVTLISICVFAAILNGVRLSISLIPEPDQKPQELSDEERLKRIYRNAYYAWVSLKDES